MAKRKSRSYENKLKILKFVEDNPSMKRCDIAEKFSVKPQTFNDLIKNADKIKVNVETRKGQSPSLKRARLITNQDVDTALITWFRQHSENPDLQIDGLMLQKKANNFSRAFGKDTEVTSSWLDRWKKRWGIGRILKAGECGGVNEVIVEEWQNTALKNILEKYEPNHIYNADETGFAPINSRLNVVVRSPIPFGLGRNGCWPSRGSQLPRALPFIFSLCCTLNDRKRAAHSFFKIGRLFSLFLFSFPSLALLRLLILLLLLMSGNVHPNPGSIFPCSVCAGNVTWRGKSVQCCTCSKWVHLRCSQLSLSIFRALGSSHSWSCPLCRNTVNSSLDSSDLYTSTVQSGPSTNAALSPHPCCISAFSWGPS